MKNEILTIRSNPDHPNHNLWLNNGTWSVAFTVQKSDKSKTRIRRSLGTKNVSVARMRRNELFRKYHSSGTGNVDYDPATTVAKRVSLSFGLPITFRLLTAIAILLLQFETTSAHEAFRSNVPNLDFHICAGGKGLDATEEKVTPRSNGVAAAQLVSKPPFISRAGWQCPEGQNSPRWVPQFTSATHLVVHHSAGANTAPDWAGVVRSIWQDHTFTRGWGDIGYNLLIAPDGTIFEGRAGGDNSIGAHFSCQNGGTYGVCLLGTYTGASPTAAALTSLKRVLAWKAAESGINPLTSAYHAGTRLTLPTICGHLDGNSSSTTCSTTVCPGSTVYSLLPAIRQEVNALIRGPIVSVPSIETRSATLVTANSAVLNGRILDTGGSAVVERRFEWAKAALNWGSGASGIDHGVIGDASIVGGTDFAATLNGLPPNTAFKYRVYARNSAGWADMNTVNVMSFTTTQNPPPSTPVAIAPSSITTSGFTANWLPSASADGYLIDVSTSSAFTTYAFQNVNVGNTTSRALAGLNPMTTYFYRIRAYNKDGTSANSLTITVTTLGNIPSIETRSATLVTANSAVLNGRIVNTGGSAILERRIEWAKLAVNWGTGMAGVDYGVIGDANIAGGTDFSGTLNGLPPNTAFKYRVYARNSAGWADMNTVNVMSFTTTQNPPPSTPVAIAPSSITTSGFTANWLPSASADGYLIDVSTSSAFTTYAFQNINVGNTTSRALAGLNPMTTYFYRIRAYNKDGTSANSLTITVTTLGVTPPTLRYETSGGFLMISWPSSVQGFILEWTDDPASGVWFPEAQAPMVSGSTYLTRVPTTGSRRFYRLVAR